MIKKFIYPVLLFISLMLLSDSASAGDTLRIQAIAASMGDSIVLRWAPKDFKSWQYGLSHGFKVERYTTKENGVDLGFLDQFDSRVLLGDTILPLALSEWEPLANQSDLAGVAAGAIYGSNFMLDTLTQTDVMSIYNVNKESEARYGFSLLAADQSIEVAKAMGLAVIDHNITMGDEYHYRITFVDDGSGHTFSQTGIVVVANGQASLVPMDKPKAIGHNLTAEISWQKGSATESYSSYFVERSIDNGLTFNRVNALPLVPTESNGVVSNTINFVDSLATNGVVYVYRVVGSSYFGIIGPPSDTVHVVGRPDPIPVHPQIDTIAEMSTGTMNIVWEFEQSYNNQITGFNILRSSERNGIYTKLNTNLLNASARAWTDNAPMGTNYYKIEAVDINGYFIPSFAQLGQINDITPPAAPQNVTGEADMQGFVYLDWDDNGEEDLMGYRVFYHNQESGEYSQVTAQWMKTSSFVHRVTLDNLSEHIYYKIVALDKRHNISEFSKECAVARPDIIAPSAPVIVKAEAILGGVLLKWRRSSADDVVRHELQRKKDFEVDWTTIASYNLGDEVFTLNDSTPTVSSLYQYRCLAYDEVNLVTSSIIVTVKPIDSGEREAIENLSYNLDLGPQLTTGAYNENAASCEITWDYPNLPGLHDFLIYRSLNGGPLRVYKTVTVMGNPTLQQQQQQNNNTTTTYNCIDDEIRFGKTYVYKVMAQFVDGGYSPMSAQVSFGL